jgi:hypothetical protein
MFGLCKICHNALICFLNILTSLQTTFAAFTQLTEGEFPQVTDNVENSLTLCIRRQVTLDTNKGWTMFHMMMTLTTPDAPQMHGKFSNKVCVTFVWLALYNIYTTYSQQHALIHILLNELHISISYNNQQETIHKTNITVIA